jgi:hypothetical protein
MPTFINKEAIGAVDGVASLGADRKQLVAEQPERVLTYNGERPVGQNDAFLNPFEDGTILDAGTGAFGGPAAPDQTAQMAAWMADPAKPFQKALAAGKRIVLNFGQHTLRGDVVILNSDVSILPGARIYGQVVIGKPTDGTGGAGLISRISIDGIRISPTALRDAIVLRNAQYVTIANNKFSACRAVIYIPPTTQTGGQTNKVLLVTGNMADGQSDYFMLAERDPSSDWKWCADFTVTNNQMRARYGGVYLDGQDGLTMNNNTLFMGGVANSGSRGKGLSIKTRSDWLIYGQAEKCFEPGEESIYLENPKQIDIRGMIAWSGQKKPSNCVTIYRDNTPDDNRTWGIIELNTRGFSLNLVGMYPVTDPAMGTVGGGDLSGLTILAGSGTTDKVPVQYYGNSIGNGGIPDTRYRYYAAPGLLAYPRILDPYQNGTYTTTDSINGHVYHSRRQLGPRDVEVSMTRTHTFTSGALTWDMLVCPSVDGKIPMSGKLWIEAREAAPSDPNNPNTSLWEINLGYNTSSNAKQKSLEVVHTAGLALYDSGTSSAVPVFTWTLVNIGTAGAPIMVLRATTVNSLAASGYSFAISSRGNVDPY